MSIKRLILMTTLAAAMLPAGVAFCQPNDHRMDPPFTDFTPFNEYTPFVEPGYFDHDLQFFAPAEIDEFSGPPKPRTGFFAEAQRMYISNDRGRADTQNFVGTDFGWGNRFVVGYMLDNGSGWTAEYQHSTNGYNDTDAVRSLNLNAAGNILFQNVVNDLTSVQSDFQTFELDKVFRMDQWANGGYWEAFIGAKYAYSRESLDFSNRQGDNLPGEFVLQKFVFEQKNSIALASLGARMSHKKGSWKLSGEVRMFGGMNFQSNFQRASFADPVTFTTGQTTATSATEEFVVGGDLLLQADYSLTRDISLNVGWLFEHYGTGMARLSADNSVHLTRTGVIFGIVVNR